MNYSLKMINIIKKTIITPTLKKTHIYPCFSFLFHKTNIDCNCTDFCKYGPTPQKQQIKYTT